MASSSKKKSKKSARALPRVPKSLRKGALPHTAAAVWEAGLGALSASLSRGKGRFDTLVAEGLRVEALGGKAVRAAVKAAQKAAASAVEAVAPAVEATAEEAERLAEAALSAAGIPQRGEMDALRAHVRRLDARLGALNGASPTPTQVSVEPAQSGWTVKVGGAEASAHRIKKDALAEARAVARAQAPSHLVVYRTDGSAGVTTDYGT